MNAKFTVRAIQQGQALKTHSVTAGAGQNGQALVLQASANTRYQLANALTFTSPAKLQLKRVGKDLLVALPGNDVASPDIVIRDYFEFEGMSLSGLTTTGEPMVYDTSSGLFSAGNTGITAQSLAPNQTAAASLAKGGAGWFDSGWGLAAVAGGVAVLAAAGGGSSTNSSLTKITTYKGDATKPVPSVTDFANAGVTGVDALNINSLLGFFPRTQLPLDSTASLQTLVDSYRKIVAEANGSAADATPQQDPTLTDYINLLGANTPLSLSSQPQALSLLNERIKNLNATEADTYAEIKALADAVDALALLVQGNRSTTGTPAAGITAAQLTSLGVDASNVTTANLAAYSDAIRAATDLGSFNTADKLSAMVKAYNTILAEANGTAIDATTANPTAADYAAIGASIGSASTDAAALERLRLIVGNLASTSVDTVEEINKLAATLDKIQTVAALATGATLTEAQKFSADELRSLGLTGFSGTEVQNTALANKVSEAIRDQDPAGVLAGSFNTQRLKTDGTREAWTQTQLERLQTLTSLEIIKNYVVDTANSANTTQAPTAADWTNVGVFGFRTADTTKFDAISAAQLAYLNTAVDALPATSVDTSAKLQAIADAYIRVVQEANGTATDANTTLNPLAGDLATIGVTGVASGSAAESLMLSIVADRSSTDVDTRTKLQALADTAAKVLQSAADQNVTFTAPELTAIGLRGASSTGTSSNLTDFNNHVKATANDGSGVNTLANLQSFMSLAVVQAWARDVNPDATANPAKVKTAAIPTAQDYKDIGVDRIKAKDPTTGNAQPNGNIELADLNALNDAIDTLVNNDGSTAVTGGDKIDTLAEVKDIAASYFKILNEANGSASNYTSGSTVQTTDGGVTTMGYRNNDTTPSDVTTYDLNPNPTAIDYVRIGVTDFSSNVLTTQTAADLRRTSLLNTVIAEKTFDKVDTVKEIQTLATAVDKVLALAAKDDADAVTAAEKLTPTQIQTDLGLDFPTNPSQDHLDKFLLAIQKTANDGTGADSFAELQSLASSTRIQRYADSNTITEGAPTAADWRAIVGLINESDANLNVANLTVYNKAVDYRVSTDVDQLSELQTLVNTYNTYVADWSQRVDSGNWGLAADLFHSLSNANQTALNAGIVGKLIDLAEQNFASGGNPTPGNVTPGGFAGTTLTKPDLAALGLDVSKVGNNTGANDGSELTNIWVDIQNKNPADITNLTVIQNIINFYAPT